MNLTDIEEEKYVRGYTMHMFDILLFSDSTINKVHLRLLSILEDFDVCSVISWSSTVLAYLYKELYKISTMKTTQLCGCQTLMQVKS